MTIHITRHASKRLRERVGIPKKSANGQAEKALRYGRSRTLYTGSVRKYLDLLWHRGQQLGGATDIIVYANSVYLFAGKYMITMWPLPKKFREKKIIKVKDIDHADDEEIYYEFADGYDDETL